MTFFKGPCILAGSHVHIPRWLTSVWTQPQFSVDVGPWPSIANRWWEELWIFFHSREVTHPFRVKRQKFFNKYFIFDLSL